MATAFSKRLIGNITAAAALCLCAGIVVARQLDVRDETISLIILIPPAAAMAGLKRRGGVFVAGVLCILFVALGFRLAVMQLLWGNDFNPPVTPQIVNATVSKTLGSGPGFRILLVESGTSASVCSPLPGYGRVFLRDNDIPLCAGDRIAFRTRIRKPTNRGNPGEYNWEIHCKSEQIGWQGSVRGERSVLLLRKGSSFFPGAVIFGVRESMSRFLELYSGRFFDDDSRREVRAVLKGIVLGDRGEIDKSLSMSFAHSGLAHMLSASGLHVGIVIMLAGLCAKGTALAVPRVLLRVPYPRAVAAVAIPAMVAYCLLVGARVPAVRATVMGLVFALAVLLDRRWNSFNSLALAAVLILIFCPLSLFTPGFQLSFLAVAGILLVVDPLTRRLRSHLTDADQDDDRVGRPEPARGLLSKTAAMPARWMLGVTVTSIAATIAVAPLVLETFHSFPVYTVFANLLAGFLLTVGLCFGLIAAAAGVVWPWLGGLLILPADVAVRLIIGIAKFFQGLPLSTVQVPQMTPWELVFASAVSFAVLGLIREPSRRATALLCASMAGLLIVSGFSYRYRSYGGDLSMVVFNVGNGDSILVRSPDSKGLLVDGGIKTPYFDTGVSVLIPFLNRTGTRELDGLVMTHPQMDHMGGLLSVVDRIPAKHLWWNPVKVVNPHLDRIMLSARRNGVPLCPADRRCPRTRMGGATVRFLNPPAPLTEEAGSSSELNDASVVFRLDYGSFSALFTGDLERNGEEELLRSGVPLRATVLKVGHHGGRASSTESFVRAVHPRIAIISADYPASQGRPGQEVIDRLKSVGAEVFWTGRDGAITVGTDGRSSIRVTLGKTGKTSVFVLDGDQDPSTNIR